MDLISDALPFGRLWYADPDGVSNAIWYAKFYSRSHRAVIRVYDDAGNVIETHDQQGLVCGRIKRHEALRLLRIALSKLHAMLDIGRRGAMPRHQPETECSKKMPIYRALGGHIMVAFASANGSSCLRTHDSIDGTMIVPARASRHCTSTTV